MADNKVNFLRGTSAEYEAKTKDNDTFYYTTDTKKLYLGENEVGNGIDPKVIQAHIDNQTIHAKVWRGTQEEYNAIEPKEDDTIYIIKDSDNTLADKLIDDTSTTATGKTWSAKKINENDEVARAAISSHAGNAAVHVSAEEKAAWNGKADVSDISNPNLLINYDFKINQRGLSSYPAGQYTVDCWKSNNINTQVTANGVKLTVVDNSSLAEFVQKLEFPYEALAGRTVAVSAIINGEYVHAAGTVPATKPDKTTHLVYTSGDWQFGLSWSVGGNFYVRFVGADGTADISSAKLEIGSAATTFCLPDPATELAKCQRYLYRLPQWGRARLCEYTANFLRFVIATPVVMRAKPSLINGDTLVVRPLNINEELPGFTYEVDSCLGNQILIKANKANHGVTDGTIVASGGDVLFSAEL